MPKPNIIKRKSIDGRIIAKALTKWLKSDEGQKCIDGTTSGQYLQNRLRSAFIAGFTAAIFNKR
jgi:hypothetical protein